MTLSGIVDALALRCHGFALGLPMLVLLGYILYLSYGNGPRPDQVRDNGCGQPGATAIVGVGICPKSRRSGKE